MYTSANEFQRSPILGLNKQRTINMTFKKSDTPENNLTCVASVRLTKNERDFAGKQAESLTAYLRRLIQADMANKEAK